jgi:hypothetical protein
MYQQAGLQPGDRGSGFADWQYWQNDALNNAGGDWNYIQNRLGNDLAGTGIDQSTGTPGQGAWSNSGRQDFRPQPQQPNYGYAQNVGPNQYGQFYGGQQYPQQQQQQYQGRTYGPRQQGGYNPYQRQFGMMRPRLQQQGSSVGGGQQTGLGPSNPPPNPQQNQQQNQQV